LEMIMMTDIERAILKQNKLGIHISPSQNPSTMHRYYKLHEM
jgi:hypothetical protein